MAPPVSLELRVRIIAWRYELNVQYAALWQLRSLL